MTYKTKSSLAALAALAVVYGGYFAWSWPPGHAAAEVLAHMIGAAILMTAIMIALEVAIALDGRRRSRSAGRVDERDVVNGLRSARNGYFALLAMIWCVPFIALLGTTPLLLANLSLAMLVVAEAVHFGSRVFYDSRGG